MSRGFFGHGNCLRLDKILRTGKGIAFISISDGSCFTPVQIVAEEDRLGNFEEISKLNTGAAVSVSGRVVLTPNAKQKFEINADKIAVEGRPPRLSAAEKAHGLDYLRTISHLRMRTNTFRRCLRYVPRRLRLCTGFLPKTALYTLTRP